MTGKEKIIDMVEQGCRPTEIFRAMLEQNPSASLIQFVIDVREIFDMTLVDAKTLGAWNHWPNPDRTWSDAEIDSHFTGLMKLRNDFE